MYVLLCFVSLPGACHSACVASRAEFLLKTDNGYPRDAEGTLFTLANPGSSLGFNTHFVLFTDIGDDGT